MSPAATVVGAFDGTVESVHPLVQTGKVQHGSNGYRLALARQRTTADYEDLDALPVEPGPWYVGATGSWFLAIKAAANHEELLTTSQATHADRANCDGIVATHNAADALLDALDRIAAVVDRTDPTDGTNDYRALDEIRAILDGAREGGG